VNKIFAVIRREFVARVRTKAFIISTVLFPFLMIFFTVMPALMMTGGTRSHRIAIVDATSDSTGVRVEQGLARQTLTRDGAEAARYLLTRIPVTAGRAEAVRDSMIGLTGFSRDALPDGYDGVLVITDAAMTEGKVSYYGSNVGSIETMARLEGAVSGVVRSARLEREGVDPAVLQRAMIPMDLTTAKVSDGETTGESGEAAFFLAYIMGFVLYMALMIYGQQTALSVIEEKGSRIMEVLASSLKPFQMLMGKVVGVGAVGLLQLGIYAVVGYLLSTQRGTIAGWFGVDASVVQSITVPQFPPDLLAVFLAYFVLGFLLYGALFAAIGSMVNSMQEMQSFMMPITMVMVFGFFGVFAAIRDPNAGLAVALSFVPFFAPMIMPVRWSMASVPMGELLFSLGLLVLGLIAFTWVAGRIYRTGILMYGKKPGVREIFRWIRAG
jgi:ABC-2 type transport system permease protein